MRFGGLGRGEPCLGRYQGLYDYLEEEEDVEDEDEEDDGFPPTFGQRWSYILRRTLYDNLDPRWAKKNSMMEDRVSNMMWSQIQGQE
ncbi:hypothetical protein GOP47_0017347 [Adiantum capillus-veneris]|uniref:Uncharacterized protein n=1 Tax=Adiantum capillus-veneris TaxID=13818 RepID=A0A9D4Z9M1_ADICA|nr:hypothetical protein GOP47_0017347 [Adiantum capillus-veneris]